MSREGPLLSQLGFTQRFLGPRRLLFGHDTRRDHDLNLPLLRHLLELGSRLADFLARRR